MLTNFAKTHIGQRKINEDSILVDESLGLYIVADGVGGLEKGDVASQIACQKVKDCIIKGETLSHSVYEAHGALVDQIESNHNKQGMATTIVAVLFKDNYYDISWVGDSRVYLWDDKLKLLTKDDSYVEILLENGYINVEDLETHPDRNIISQALGMTRKEITVNHNSGTLERNQVLLVCSDGLYSIANEIDMINELNLYNSMMKLTDNLVNIAVKNNGMDNISLVSIKSDANTHDDSESINPFILREFDTKTGKVNDDKVCDTKNQQQTDPELVDQTTLKELTQYERDLLDSAAQMVPQTKEKTNYIIPILLFSIVVVVTIIIFIFR